MRKIWIGILLWVAAFVAGALLVSQSDARNGAAAAKQHPELDHATVHVRDLAKSGEFYDKVMGLERIADPFNDGRHIWYRVGPHQQLHMASGATEMAKRDIEVHTAFRVESVAEFRSHLDQMHVKYQDIKGGEGKEQVRPDGVHQIYFQDPDGYWIEVNDDKF